MADQTIYNHGVGLNEKWVDNGDGTFSLTVAASVAANSAVNLAQVGGASTAVGHGTAATALRVELPTDGTGVVGLNAGTALVGKVGLDQTTPGTTNAVAPIAGQNGVQGGSGVVGATTQRVVLATDVALPAATVPAVSVASSTAYEASRVVKASAGKLVSVFGYNSKGSAQFIQIHNATSLPADTAVPLATFTVPASSNFNLDVPISGIPCGTGIVVANSSTGPTLTIGSADCFFTAVYI